MAPVDMTPSRFLRLNPHGQAHTEASATNAVVGLAPRWLPRGIVWQGRVLDNSGTVGQALFAEDF